LTGELAQIQEIQKELLPIEKGNENAIWSLLNRDFDVNATANRRLEISGAKAKNSSQVAPLDLASENGNTAVVPLFLRHGADFKASSNIGHVALSFAAINGHIAVA